MTLNYAAACLFGLEGMVGQIDELGYKRTETIDAVFILKATRARRQGST